MFLLSTSLTLFLSLFITGRQRLEYSFSLRLLKSEKKMSTGARFVHCPYSFGGYAILSCFSPFVLWCLFCSPVCKQLTGLWKCVQKGELWGKTTYTRGNWDSVKNRGEKISSLGRRKSIFKVAEWGTRWHLRECSCAAAGHFCKRWGTPEPKNMDSAK